MKFSGKTIVGFYFIAFLLRLSMIAAVPFAIIAACLGCVWCFVGWVFIGKQSFTHGENVLDFIYDFYISVIEKIDHIKKLIEDN